MYPFPHHCITQFIQNVCFLLNGVHVQCVFFSPSSPTTFDLLATCYPLLQRVDFTFPIETKTNKIDNISNLFYYEE